MHITKKIGVCNEQKILKTVKTYLIEGTTKHNLYFWYILSNEDELYLFFS